MSSTAKPNPVVKHPYLPKDVKLPHYVPNVRTGPEILVIFGVIALAIVVITWIISGRRKEPFCLMRRAVLCWFMLCAFIHVVVEGYFVIYNATLAGHTTFLGELWKEYSRCDSRYLSGDTFTVCMEGITAIIDGPLAFLTFFAFMNGNNYRYAMQMILSICQLYGDTLYYLTAVKDGFAYGPTDNIVFFYGYFLFVNAIWIVIPLLLVIDSCRHIAACQIVSDFYIDEYNLKVGNSVRNHHKKKN